MPTILTVVRSQVSQSSEAQLSEQLGIGRTPIRAALIRLSLENLIIMLPRRGTIVADLNASDLHKLYEIR